MQIARFSRRSIIMSCAAVPNLLLHKAAGELPGTPLMPDSLHIRDYRIFPTPDVTRFIIEVHNSSDSIVDTPSIGVVLPHIATNKSFAVAVSGVPLLYPKSSAALIGVAPLGLESDDNWGTPEWVTCDQPQTSRADEVRGYDVRIESSVGVDSDDEMFIWGTISNHGKTIVQNADLSGYFVDSQGRICGMVLPWGIYGLPPGTSWYFEIHITRTTDYIGNPFNLLSSPVGLSAELSVQPSSRYVPLSCPSVLPWNR